MSISTHLLAQCQECPPEQCRFARWPLTILSAGTVSSRPVSRSSTEVDPHAAYHTQSKTKPPRGSFLRHLPALPIESSAARLAWQCVSRLQNCHLLILSNRNSQPQSQSKIGIHCLICILTWITEKGMK